MCEGLAPTVEVATLNPKPHLMHTDSTMNLGVLSRRLLKAEPCTHQELRGAAEGAQSDTRDPEVWHFSADDFGSVL